MRAASAISRSSPVRWPSASLMSFRPSRSRNASVTTSPCARPASTPSISSIILRWLGRPVSMSSWASVQASCSLAPRSRTARRTCQSAMPAKPTRKIAGHRQQRLELAERIAHRAVRLPGEPADDAALAVQHRLDLAVAVDRLGLEAQVLQPCGALHALDVAGVERGEVGAGVADVLDGAEQRRAPLQPLAVVGLAHQGVADDGAEEGRAQHEQRQRRHQTRRPQPARGRPLMGGCNTHDKRPVRQVG